MLQTIADSSFRTVANHLKFAEGPLWHPNGYWLFSDVEAGVIWNYDGTAHCSPTRLIEAVNRQVDTDLVSHHAGPNGLALNKDGYLLICHHGLHCILIYDDFGCRPLVRFYRGRQLNSPNDLVVHDNGSIYFTDPPYGLRNQQLHPGRFQDAAGIFLYREGECVRLSCALQFPNGICLSPDQRYLYVSSNHPGEKMILRFTIMADGITEKPELFAEENSDGMTCDRMGNLYLTGSGNLRVLDPSGKLKTELPIKGMTTNVAIGGPGQNELLVTAGRHVYHFNQLPLSGF